MSLLLHLASLINLNHTNLLTQRHAFSHGSKLATVQGDVPLKRLLEQLDVEDGDGQHVVKVSVRIRQQLLQVVQPHL